MITSLRNYEEPHALQIRLSDDYEYYMRRNKMYIGT